MFPYRALCSRSPVSGRTIRCSTRYFVYLLQAPAPLPPRVVDTYPGSSALPFAILLSLSVRMLPIMKSPRLARVSPTFSLRLSARNPICPDGLLRTVEKMITSFSRPSNPSTVLISMSWSCSLRWSPRVVEKRLRYFSSELRRRVNNET